MSKKKATTDTETPAEVMVEREPSVTPTEAAIAELAYSYWESRRYQDQGGSPQEDWFRAEEELRNRVH
jgi:hypothetical protein